jgi:hypothetical protein
MLDAVSGKHGAPAALFPEINPGTHGIGGWVGARVRPDTLEKRKVHCLCRIAQIYTIL